MFRHSAVLLLTTFALFSQEAPKPEAPKPPKPAAAAPLEDKTSATSHTVRIGWQEIKYTATAGALVMKKEDGTPVAMRRNCLIKCMYRFKV